MNKTDTTFTIILFCLITCYLTFMLTHKGMDCSWERYLVVEGHAAWHSADGGGAEFRLHDMKPTED